MYISIACMQIITSIFKIQISNVINVEAMEIDKEIIRNIQKNLQ